MKKIAMIIMDVDGTLLNNQHQISNQTKQVLNQALQQKIPITLASGRDIVSISKIGRKLNLQDYSNNHYITLNGLKTFDIEGNLISGFNGIDYEEAINISNYCKNNQLDLVYCFNRTMYTIQNGQSGYIDYHLKTMERHFVDEFNQIPKELFAGLDKVAIIQNENIINQNMEQLKNSFKDLNISRVEPYWVEMTPKGVDKGTALQKLTKDLNIDLNQCIAFGNAENDIAMLQCVGHGVAMGNAFENVKSQVQYECLSNDEDGIGKYLINQLTSI